MGEARRLRSVGVEVLLIQPTVHDLDAMGSNLMSRGRRNEVIDTAVRSMTDHLRETSLGRQLRALPRGLPALVRRPKGKPDTWKDFRELAAARWSDSGPRVRRSDSGRRVKRA